MWSGVRIAALVTNTMCLGENGENTKPTKK